MMPTVAQLERRSLPFGSAGSGWYSLYVSFPYTTTALIVWEYCITLDDEINFFWFSKLSWIKCLFFANRYIRVVLQVGNIIITELGDTRCLCPDAMDSWKVYNSTAAHVYYFLSCPTSVVYVQLQVLVMESILTLRVWAMSGRRRSVIYVLSFFLLLSTGTSAFLVVGDETFLSAVIYWIPMLLFEFLLFLTAAIHGLRGVKITRILTQARDNFGPKPIMRLLLRESVLYFAVVACCYPVLVWLTERQDNEMGLALMSITVTRMLLRLRKRAETDSNIPHTQDVELETVQFANSATEVTVASDA
ncbi:hypothetical protein DFS33DRAFT_1339262 [Desarmillaria ectypa]|nr:hypothetical protein DFS33DRAFT_1339262 [Desarmillaria ectypa]